VNRHEKSRRSTDKPHPAIFKNSKNSENSENSEISKNSKPSENSEISEESASLMKRRSF
jgi:hypothetical protein